MGSSSSTQRFADQPYLTQDLWHVIFLYIPLDSIFKLRCVSKLWLSILSNPNFINQWYDVNKLSLPWAFAIGIRKPVEENKTFRMLSWFTNYSLENQFTIAHPAELHSKIPSQSDFSFKFLNQIQNFWNELYIIGSSNGLVLCTIGHPVQPTTYYVCNPLTKRWVSLPRPPKVYIGVVTGFMCNESLVSTSYTVIRMPFPEAGELKIQIFTSDLGEWNVYHGSRPQNFVWGYDVHDSIVTHNGVFYWLPERKSRILAVIIDGNNKQCGLISLPEMDDNIKDNTQCLGESEGLIYYARFNRTRKSLSVWMLQAVGWYLVHMDIIFCDLLAQMKSSLIGGESTDDDSTTWDIQVLGLSPNDKNVITFRYNKYIWAYNTKTKGYEKLCHPSLMGRNGGFTFVLKPRPTILPPASW